LNGHAWSKTSMSRLLPSEHAILVHRAILLLSLLAFVAQGCRSFRDVRKTEGICPVHNMVMKVAVISTGVCNLRSVEYEEAKMHLFPYTWPELPPHRNLLFPYWWRINVCDSCVRDEAAWTAERLKVRSVAEP